ncbi:hypothetical protein AB6G19_04525 [Providencia manganoxydans]|uniref:Uncharacterized protein n=1 Tax=Providencia manganoxydans TaxID=2923283 RepID=A0ABX7AD12_9GAMM|nr:MULTISPECIES: hypothetical protein [Providencia]MDX4947464.1 hypothetical protein [Providencia manganoxydans]QQO61557.1 hypothetical protein JI723_14975 [Providencia manganoxydans]
MKQVQAMTTLVLIDGVTYQIALPKQYVLLQTKQALMMATEFEGRLVKCDFADLQPMKAEGMPFNINHG